MEGKRNFKVLLRLIRNKFVFTTLIVIVWMIFFDQNSIIDRVSLTRGIRNLKQEKEHLISEINKNKEKINELQSGSENVEKFAREEYLMKKTDEDLYIIIYE